MIKAEHIKKIYHGHYVFNDLSLTVNDGEVVGIIAASGSGKSVLLRTLMMIEIPDSGEIFLDDVELTKPGADLKEARKNIGLVFQDFNLFSHLTAIENVLSGLIHLRNENPQVAFDKAMSLLGSVGLKEKAYLYPKELSGGQKQRVAIARTLAMDPTTILFDEPTSSLDPSMKGEVETVIQLLAREKRTMVIASHELEFIRSICNRVVFLYNGKIWEEGAPDQIFDNPQKEETRRFIRALRIINFDISSKTYDFIGMQTSISQFAMRNGISKDLSDKLRSIMEELCQMIIIDQSENNKMSASFEYDQKEKSLNGSIKFSGKLFDPDDPLYVFSWPIIKLRSSNVSYEQIEEDGYTNKINIEIK